MVGSAPVAVQDARTQQRARAIVAALCAAAVLAVGLAAWAILDGRGRTGGVAAFAAGACLVLGGVLAARARDVRARMLVSFGDRAFDGAVLGAVAWASRSSEPAAAAGALLCLAAAFLAAYVRARGSALGYLVEGSTGTRALRVGLVSIALLAGWTGWALFGVAVWLLLVTLLRVSQVAKEERA